MDSQAVENINIEPPVVLITPAELKDIQAKDVSGYGGATTEVLT